MTVSVRPSKQFSRKGFDLYLDFPISFTKASLGGEILVPTLNGTVKSTVSPGTQPGTVLRLSGQGIQHLKGSGKGDLLVNLKVQVPKKLNEEQKNLLEQLAKSFGETVIRPEKRSIFGKKK